MYCIIVFFNVMCLHMQLPCLYHLLQKKYYVIFFTVNFQIVTVFQRVKFDSCIYVIKILFNLNTQANEKL